MHDILFDHAHGEEELGRLEDNPLWIADHITLKSVGIDIGSAGTQVTFSELTLRRMGEDLTSRYVVVGREPLYYSPVSLTPYQDEERIDEKAVGELIVEAYRASGLGPQDVDTGVVLLTGEAIRRRNAQAIGEVLAAQGGEFVCTAAGHNMEAQLAAFGSGAALASYEQHKRILNVDIGGGTTKLAVVEDGKVLETAALHVGGRLLVVDGEGRIVRLDPAGKALASHAGFQWDLGDSVRPEELERLAEWMSEAIVSAVTVRPLPAEIEGLFLTPVLRDLEGIRGVMFSGGVGEYVYGREERDFGDLGKLLGQALHRELHNGSFLWPLLPPGECIRATVIGAASYSLQVSGNTVHVSTSEMLPRKNLQVLHPACDLGGEIEPDRLAAAIRDHFGRFDLVEGEKELALAFRWHGQPAYGRVRAFVEGVVRGLSETVRQGRPLFLVLDGDLAQTVGALLREEVGVTGEILVIDGIALQDFDFIDIGRMLEPSKTVPVTVKSLVF
ncbi:MAG TPA: ethanolamine ammonia-lyase reactivating factor EutA, partial [Deferrisomatales bacterium]|nr:ethanolamine ammonia-lyase reactivating factor EutA [Deferrisomatales bacterium]